MPAKHIRHSTGTMKHFFSLGRIKNNNNIKFGYRLLEEIFISKCGELEIPDGTLSIRELEVSPVVVNVIATCLVSKTVPGR